MGIGARNAYVGLRKVRVMDCAVANVEGHAAAGGGGGTARAQEIRSSGTGYD